MNVAPVISNTGSVPMYCFIKVDIPYSVLDGSEGVEWYDVNPSAS